MTSDGMVYPFVVDLVSKRVPPDGVVLEVGCGAMQYASHLPGKYVGLDLPTSRYVRARPHIVGSAADIPLDDGSVDVLFGVATFYYMEPIDQVFRECRRVLRRGGRLLVFDYQQHVLRGLVERGDNEVAHCWDAREVRARLRRAGFARAAIRELSHRAEAAGDSSILRRPVRLAKRILVPEWTQWLIFEARA